MSFAFIYKRIAQSQHNLILNSDMLWDENQAYDLFAQEETQTIDIMTLDDRISSRKWEEVNKLTLAYQEDQQNSLWSQINNPSQQKIKDEAQEIPQREQIQEPSQTLREPNYEKNICSYVTKKVVQCFLSKSHSRFVKQLCRKGGCNYEEAIEYYSKRFRQVFGVAHLSILIRAENENEIAMKRMFCAFFTWFLRQRYMLYILQSGKMSQKQKYIDFKNKYIINITKISESYQHMF